LGLTITRGTDSRFQRCWLLIPLILGRCPRLVVNCAFGAKQVSRKLWRSGGSTRNQQKETKVARVRQIKLPAWFPSLPCPQQLHAAMRAWPSVKVFLHAHRTRKRTSLPRRCPQQLRDSDAGVAGRGSNCGQGLRRLFRPAAAGRSTFRWDTCLALRARCHCSALGHRPRHTRSIDQALKARLITSPAMIMCGTMPGAALVSRFQRLW